MPLETIQYRWACLLVFGAIMATGGCGGSKTLATQVDDLLRAGKIAEANRKLAQELPDLVQAGKVAEADKVAAAVQRNVDALPPMEASNVRRISVKSYFEGVTQSASELPLDDVCQAAVTARRPPADGASLEEVVQYVQEQEKRESAALFCELLGLEF